MEFVWDFRQLLQAKMKLIGTGKVSGFLHVCTADRTNICLNEVCSSMHQGTVKCAQVSGFCFQLFFFFFFNCVLSLVEYATSVVVNSCNMLKSRSQRCRHRIMFAIWAFETFASWTTSKASDCRNILDKLVMILTERPIRCWYWDIETWKHWDVEELVIHPRRYKPVLCYVVLYFMYSLTGLWCALYIFWLQGIFSWLIITKELVGSWISN